MFLVLTISVMLWRIFSILLQADFHCPIIVGFLSFHDDKMTLSSHYFEELNISYVYHLRSFKLLALHCVVDKIAGLVQSTVLQCSVGEYTAAMDQ